LALDVRNQEQLKRVLRDHGPFHGVLHLAGRVGVSTVLQDPEGCRGVTRDLISALCGALTALPRGQRPRLLAASTSEVYCDASGPLEEDAPLRREDGQGRWAYAGSRVEAERALDGAGLLDRCGRAPIHLRFFNVTGPGHRPESGMVLPRFIAAAQAGQPLPVHGDGTQERTFAHVQDIARDLADLIQMGDAPAGPLNLGGIAHARVLDLAQMVVRLAGPGSGQIEFVDPKAAHPSFEEIKSREPNLNRAHQLGLARNHRSLDEIVQAMLFDIARPDSPRPPVLCASPVSSPV